MNKGPVLREPLVEYGNLIRKELQEQIARLHPSMAAYFYYHFGWEGAEGKTARMNSSGKMVRPLLCLLSCETCGGKISQALPAACAIELIHNFSLIHDDIEDNSLERRHRPALWKAFGVAPAINAGDAMFSLGYRALISPVSVKRVLARYAAMALDILTQSCLDLCEGQNLDLRMENSLEANIEEYYYMVQRKTAALFQASTYLGALLSQFSEAGCGHFRDFGLKLGMAFQIQDDILGIWGEKEKTGKPVSDDIINKKKTLPVIYSLKMERDEGLDNLGNIYCSEKVELEQVPLVIEILDKYKSKEYCTLKVNSLYREALASLRASGISRPSLKGLESLSGLCLGKRENEQKDN